MPPEDDNEPNVQVEQPPEPEQVHVPINPEPDDDPDGGPPEPKLSRDEQRRQRGRTYAAKLQEEREARERVEAQLAEERESRAKLEGRFEQLERAVTSAGSAPEVPPEIAHLDREISIRERELQVMQREWAAIPDAAGKAAYKRQHDADYVRIEKEAMRLQVRREMAEERAGQPQQQQRDPRRDAVTQYLELNYNDVVSSADGRREFVRYRENWKLDNPGKQFGPGQIKEAADAARKAMRGAGPGGSRRASPTAADRERFAAPGRSAGGSGGETTTIARTDANIKTARALKPGVSDDEALAHLARVRHQGRNHVSGGRT